MGDLIKRILSGIWKLFFGWMKSGLSPHSPEERADLQAVVQDYLSFGLKEYIEEIERWKSEAREVRPDVAWTEALTVAELGRSAYVNINVAGILMEILSAGQIETVSRLMSDYMEKLGPTAAMKMWLEDPMEIGIRTPNRYYLNSLFKPMIPGISDQIRFAVREAYPGVTVEGMLDEMRKWIAYQGYSDFWADSYWNAHWIIPTLEQARVLYWRNVIDLDEYKRMVRLSDYHPKFNPYWLELAWEYPGRIDQRWMYEWNLIDREQLKAFVRSRGIHPDWEDAVVDAYVKNILRDEIGRVRTQLITHYREGFLSRDQLTSSLTDLGFRKEVVDMSVREADLRIELEDKTEWYKIYEKQFTSGTIDEETFIAKLTELGMTSDAITRKLALAKTKLKA